MTGPSTTEAAAQTGLPGPRASWRGTIVEVFQPGLETGQGARVMIDPASTAARGPS